MSKQQVIGLLGSPSIADPFHNQRWDYTTTQRTGRTGHIERKNLILYFENDTLARWDGDYFPEQDEQLTKDLRRAFGPNLAKDKKGRQRQYLPPGGPAPPPFLRAPPPPFHNQRWDYTTTQRTGRTGHIERKNLILYFENDTLARWDGDYFPEQDEQLTKDLRRAFGPNLAKDKKGR